MMFINLITDQDKEEIKAANFYRKTVRIDSGDSGNLLEENIGNNQKGLFHLISIPPPHIKHIFLPLKIFRPSILLLKNSKGLGSIGKREGSWEVYHEKY